jgi:predicted RNase H-like nuclease (RuvC/YqgF family)
LPKNLYQEKLNTPRVVDVEDRIQKNNHSLSKIKENMNKLNYEMGNAVVAANESLRNSLQEELDTSKAHMTLSVNLITNSIEGVISLINKKFGELSLEMAGLDAKLSEVNKKQEVLSDGVQAIVKKLDEFSVEEVDAAPEMAALDESEGPDDCYEEAYIEEFEE